jgi:protein phosphatase-4 regulatory subunit 3
MELFHPRKLDGHLRVYFVSTRCCYLDLCLDFCSPRSGGLVDYDDDEDDEDYRPPLRKQPETSDEDEGTMESLRLKRKLASKDNKPEVSKKQRIGKNSKTKDNVLTALCSTLSQAVLPSKKTPCTTQATSHTADGNQSSSEENHQENKPDTDRSCSDNSSTTDENHREKEPPASRTCSDHLHSTSDDRQLGGEESPLIPPKSSPEMAVNGS